MIALQLDLARQYETPEAIGAALRFAARWGYDTIVLYLEDRIRTPSYPYPDPAESYAAEAIRAVVAEAAALGLEVIPVVSTLGHAERFLRHPQMRQLGELRAGGTPRSGDGWNVMCPSIEAGYAFWSGYLAEIAALFPSRYIHIGCDEVWNLGLCPDCRAALAGGSTVGDLFAAHVRRIHAILAGLGKQAMMWDDMFEDYPEALDQVPSDIVQCVWQYDQVVPRTQSHFGNRSRDHRLAGYDRRGIRYLIAPTAWSALNAATFTAYAARFRPAGWLMTRWEGSFLEEDAPIIAFAGHLWSRPSELTATERFTVVAKGLLGRDDPLLTAALWSRVCTARQAVERGLARLLDGPSSAYAEEYRNATALALRVLAGAGLPPGPAQEMLGDQIARGEQDMAQIEARTCLHALTRAWSGGSPPPPARVAELDRLVHRLAALADYWRACWARRRPGIADGCRGHHAAVESLRLALADHHAALAAGRPPHGGLLVVRYALPDYYHWPHARWSVRFAGDPAWHQIYDANPKVPFRDPGECPFYAVATPLDDDRVPERLRIEFSGFGGLGVLHLEWFGAGRVFRPVAVAGAHGRVDHPERLLVDDTRWTWFGPLDAHGAFRSDSGASVVHSLEIVLAAGAVAVA